MVRGFDDAGSDDRGQPRIKDLFAVIDPWLKGYFQMLVNEFEMSAANGQRPDSFVLSQTEHLLIRHLVRWHSEPSARQSNVLQSQRSVNPLPSSVMRRVQEYVAANFAQEIRLHDLASIAHMSNDHFLRAFRAASGITPYRYVLEQRLQKACLALKNSNAPIAHVAVECGFNTPAHLSSRFHARVGVSPSKYRAAVQEAD